VAPALDEAAIAARLAGFPARLRTLRRGRGWTREALAERSGVDVRQIAYYEGGRHLPELRRLLRLAAAFDLTTDELVCGG
jgi:transcriptional regulator with XRE-family HTH domain